MSKSSLKLFSAVPASDKNQDDFHFFSQYGVVVDGSALHELDTVGEYLREEELSGNQLNQTFHKSWQKVAQASPAQLMIEQVVHYLSTYGLAAIGLYSDDTIYIPGEALDVPVSIPLKVIKGLPAEQLRDRALSMLQSGTALEQETIEDLLAVLDECGYRFTGEEMVKNKEAQAIIADRTGVLPRGDDLLRYLVYKSTGSTLLIKNEATFAAIQESGITLPELKGSDLVALAQSFNRYKPIWLSFKKADRANASLINKIAKLSIQHHRPLPKDVLSNLTNTEYSKAEVEDAIANADTSRLVRAINAVRFYQQDPENRFYSIRNGKGWAQRKSISQETRDLLSWYEEQLREALQGRVRVSDVFLPDHVDYAVPTSEKQYVGNIPAGTQVSISQSEEHFLVGIYWEGSQVDLDLRADSVEGSIGWNADYRNQGRTLMFSGDITSAPNGAAEWVYAQAIDAVYLIKVNLFSGPIEHPFQIIAGYGSDIEKNHMADPNKVLFQADAQMTQREMTIGVLEPTEAGVNFYLCGQGTGEKRVGGGGMLSDIIRLSLVNQYRTKLRLSELVTVREDSTLDLSPDKLDKDSISSLFG